MGKKVKVGKQRKDKYYQLAKETGYRSRAAFKLIQLNRKFGFLEKSRICIDLCAAPGGWMQVAHQNMPLSSVVIGVDLFPIKPVSGCIAITEDITSEKCKSALTKELKTWKADIVLHDGAPNVGRNWLHDAYQQASLTLSALKLTTQFLKQGGWFVTKVFRSKDYHSLIWVFKQLFKKVYATKPQASRNESAEIFVVCQHYIAPDKLDGKFLDPKYVFEDFEVSKRNLLNILHPEKQKKPRAEGYPENDYTLHHKVSVNDFIAKENVIDALRECSEIVIDDESISNHPKTTIEIKECCKDIKVLGKKDLRALMAWSKQMRDFKTVQKEDSISADVTVEVEKNEDAESVIEDDELTAVDEQISKLEAEENVESRRKRKRVNKERQKLAQKMNLKMVIKGDEGPQLEGEDMFSLKQVKTMKDLQETVDQNPDVLVESDNESDPDLKLNRKYLLYNNEKTQLDKSGKFYKDTDSFSEIESDLESNLSEEGLGFSGSDVDEMPRTKKIKKNNVNGGESEHPLLKRLESDPKSRRELKAELWFEKDTFKNVTDHEDEDYDLDKLSENLKGKNQVHNKTKTTSKSSVLTKALHTSDSGASSGESSDLEESGDDSSDSDYDIEKMNTQKKLKPQNKTYVAGKDDSFEVVPQNAELKRLKKQLKMDEETLALGTMIATSKKFKRDLIDDGWNRYMFNDTNLPDWFKEDELKNMKRPTKVPENFKEEYNKRMEDINVRPIKKVMEAKARKKKRLLKRMERAKKKVENVMENADMTDREKAKQVKQLYKKAQTPKKKEITYVVSKKHTAGKRMKRPSGVKGPYKVVDSRMKKDLRSAKAKEKKMKHGPKKFQRKPKKGAAVKTN